MVPNHGHQRGPNGEAMSRDTPLRMRTPGHTRVICTHSPFQSKRIVTVRELARSQGFPDHFVFSAQDNRVVTVSVLIDYFSSIV
jgi:site-specific DNA-cytosine methylase